MYRPRGRRATSGWLVALLGVAIAACPTPPPEAPAWQTVFSDLDAAVLSVWAAGPNEVYVVGADSGQGPLVMQYTGTHWSRKGTFTFAQGDLWWVSGLGDSVWMAGDNGLILRYSRQTGAFEPLSVTTSATLFGIFPLSETNVWAVGGDIVANKGEAWHYDGSAWTQVTDLPAELTQATLFKVWGRASNDVWVVGLGTAAGHLGPGGWEVVPTKRRLLTVHGNSELTVAVGGYLSGHLVEGKGTALTDVTPETCPQLNGVFVGEKTALAVGNDGAVLRRDGAGIWALDPEAPSTPLNFHATFIDSAGGEWAVGGFWDAPPETPGIIAHRGAPVSSALQP